jgi:integrase
LKGLRWRDVDFIERTLTIRRSKTAAGLRVIPLNAEAWSAILELRQKAKALFGENLNLDWYLFFRKEGSCRPEPDKPAQGWRSAWRSMTRAIICPQCKRVQNPGVICSNEECKTNIRKLTSPLAGLRFHDLRHHAITELAEGQGSDQTIRSIAGHVSEKMLEHYSHVRLDAKRAALDSLPNRSGESCHVTNHVTNRPETQEPDSEVIEKNGGRQGTRTPGLLVANEALFQLS